MYGDIFTHDLGPGNGVDVSIDLGNGKFFKVYTDPDGGHSTAIRSVSPVSYFGTTTKIWSKP